MARQYIRHPAHIPIQIIRSDHFSTSFRHVVTHNISHGGLACESEKSFLPGDMVEIIIPVTNPPFSCIGHVIWCETLPSNAYLIGVGFDDFNEAYSVRMIEQVCHIEEYRKEMSQKSGHEMAPEQAACEWIAKYAKDFPKLH
jgi:Tfp pilus assembly protein PilZ